MLVKQQQEVCVEFAVVPGWPDDRSMRPGPLRDLVLDIRPEDRIVGQRGINGLDPGIEELEAALAQVHRVAKQGVEVGDELHRGSGLAADVLGETADTSSVNAVKAEQSGWDYRIDPQYLCRPDQVLHRVERPHALGPKDKRSRHPS